MSVQEDVTLLATLEAQDDASAIVEDVRSAFEDVGTSIQNMDDATTTAGAEGADSMGLISNALVGVADVAGQVFDEIEKIATVVGVVGAALDVLFIQAVDSAKDYAGQLTTVEFLTGETSQQSAALIAGFEGVGISTQGAVSMLTRLSANLGALSTAQNAHGKISAAQALEMKQLGISFLNSHGDMLPMTQLMPVIIDHLKNMTNYTERDRLARTLFGRSFADLAPLIQAGGAAFVKASGDAAIFGNNLSQDQVDALNKFKSAQQQVKEAIDGFTGTMAEKALPLLMAFETGVKNIYMAYQALSPGTRQAIQDGLLLVATLGTLGGGALALGHGLSAVAKFLGPLAPLAERLAPALLGIAGPFALVAALAIGLYLAYEHVAIVHQTLEPWVKKIGSAFQIVVGAVREGIDVWNRFHDPVSAVEAAMVKLGIPMDTILNVAEVMRGALTNLREALVQIGNQVLPALKSAWTELGPAIKQIQVALVQLQPLWELLKIVMGVMIAGALILIAGLFHAFVNLLAFGVPTAINLVVNVIKVLADIFTLLGHVVQDVAKFITDMVHGNFRAAANDLHKLFFDLVTDVWKLLYDFGAAVVSLFIGLVGTVIATIGGFVKGIVDAFVWLWDKLVGHSIIPDIVNDIIRWFTGLPGTILGIISGLATSMITAAKNLGINMITGITSGLSGLRSAILHALKVALQNLPGGMGNALIGPLGLSGYASGGLVGPSYGGPRMAVVGEGGQDEVIATMSQVMRAGMLANGTGTSSGGGGDRVTVVNLYMDGKLIQRQVMKGAANDFRLRGGNMGSSA